MIYHFPTEFIDQNSYFSLRTQKHPSQRLGNLFKINCLSIIIVIRQNQLRRPFVTSDRVLNANPRPNAHFTAFDIGEHTFLENWFIHLAIFSRSNKFSSLSLMVLCYSMFTCHDYVLLGLICKFLSETGFALCFDICQIIDRCSLNCSKNGNGKIYSEIHVVQVCL